MATGELPPRARRIPVATSVTSTSAGTTSACAENTPLAGMLTRFSGNYLRVRGEYRYSYRAPGMCRELPPRARRIHGLVRRRHVLAGTTSACAENTFKLRPPNPRLGNYLRVRGEYDLSTIERISPAELPPRARRIHTIVAPGFSRAGTTSACAENTRHVTSSTPYFWNYLRVRGEYEHQGLVGTIAAELPPRARRILREGL